MGHLLGSFNNPFFGIEPTKKTVMLWYCEFYRVENNKITEGAFFLDILKFMQHLKLSVVPDSTGMVGFNPGPKTHDGLYFEKQSYEEGNKTLDLSKSFVSNSAEGNTSPSVTSYTTPHF